MFSQLRLPTRTSSSDSTSSESSTSPSTGFRSDIHSAVSKKALPATYVKLTTPGGRTLTVRADEVDFIDLELCDALLDPTPPPAPRPLFNDFGRRGPHGSDKRAFESFLKSLPQMHVGERNRRMLAEMRRMMDRAEEAMRVHATLLEEGRVLRDEGKSGELGLKKFEATWLVTKNYHDTMVCHVNHGKDLWEEVKQGNNSGVAGRGDCYVHQENLKDAWVKGREVEEFLKERGMP